MHTRLNSAVYTAKRSAIREFSRLAKETPGCVALTLGEPDFNTPESVCDTACLSIKNGETHYIENNGSKALREAISAFEREKNGMDYTPDEIIVTSGATEALFTALFGILNPGDEVIIPTPAFVLYEEIVKLCRAKAVFLDTEAYGFQINEEKLLSLINNNTKAIILNTPNNPTGCILSKQSLDGIYRCVKAKGIFVICDDVYRQLVYEGEFHSFTEYRDIREQIILVQSFSKPYAMTGWRVGYLCADVLVKERLELIHQFMVVSTPALFQKACIKALGENVDKFLDTYKRRREYVLKRLAEIGLQVVKPEGAFYVFPSINEFGIDSAEFCRRMIREAGLAATPGSCFGVEGYIRLTYCYSDEQLKTGLDRLECFVRMLRGKNA